VRLLLDGLEKMLAVNYMTGKVDACLTAAGLLSRAGYCREATIVLTAVAKHIQAGIELEAATVRVVEAVYQKHCTAQSPAPCPVDDLTIWRAEGEAMTIEELADFTLTALRETQVQLEAETPLGSDPAEA
jgi:hypothetical protein